MLLEVITIKEEKIAIIERNETSPPTFEISIYDINKNRLAYSDYNYSIKNTKNKVKYLERDVPLKDILVPIYKGDPYIKFEKILTRKYPYKNITNNFIGHTNIEHKGISLIEKYVDQNNNDIDLSIDIQIQKRIYDSLLNDTINLNPDYSLNVLVDLSREEIVSNVFLDNRNVDDRFDQTFLPLKDLKFDFDPKLLPIKPNTKHAQGRVNFS